MAHQDLHSFPTRRSSDLVTPASTICGRRTMHRLAALLAAALMAGCATYDDGHGRYDYTGADRSEEHTSELQSRLHLVCRLLLEKKKFQRQISSFLNASAS